jgi:hypothetical protein
MSITYRTTPDQWSPGYMAVHLHDDGRLAVVIDGRPVFSGTGYTYGPFHDDRAKVSDILSFAYWRTCDGVLPVAGQVWPDDLDAMRDELENGAAHECEVCGWTLPGSDFPAIDGNPNVCAVCEDPGNRD